MLVLSIGLVSLLVAGGLCHESFLGRCPFVPPMKDFEMEKFEGLWYMAESFNKGLRCVTWNITKTDVPGEWTLTEAMESGAIYTIGLEHATFNAASLTAPNPSKPALMRLRWPLSFAGDSAFTVHSTDYDKSAGIFECQNVGIFHRQNGVVLSRTPILKVNLKQLARVNPAYAKVEYYQKVQQGNCRYYFDEEENEPEIRDFNIPFDFISSHR